MRKPKTTGLEMKKCHVINEILKRYSVSMICTFVYIYDTHVNKKMNKVIMEAEKASTYFELTISSADLLLISGK